MSLLGLAILVAASLAGGCMPDNFGVFLPVRTESYALPGNDIPLEAVTEETLVSEDGVRLAALLAVQDNSSAHATVLFLHGQGGHLDDAWAWVTQLWHRGYNVYAIDYRGFGKSEGTPSEAGLYLDARAAWTRLLGDARFDARRLVIWGHSMGTGVASGLALAAPAAALVLEAPFTSMTDMARLSGPYGLPPAWYTDVELDTVSRIAAIAMPVLVAQPTIAASRIGWASKYSPAPSSPSASWAPGTLGTLTSWSAPVMR